MIRCESCYHARHMLSQPPFKIIGMASIKITAATMEHICPKTHVRLMKERQGFDKLSPNGDVMGFFASKASAIGLPQSPC
jgi:hypothetical protein